MVMEEREAVFRQAQAEQAYNLRLLDEYRHAKGRLTAGTTIAMDMDVPEQQALLRSYHFARDIRRKCWCYRYR